MDGKGEMKEREGARRDEKRRGGKLEQGRQFSEAGSATQPLICLPENSR